jgi:predicted transposase YbfD/YdcC
MVTIDAMGCQTQIAAQMVEQGGDSLLALQNNHKTTSTAIPQHFHHHIEHNLPWRKADNFFDAFDNAHGRHVRRRVWIMTDVVSLPVLEQWPGLHTVLAVETMRMAHKQAPVTRDDRFYLSSLRRSADTFVRMIRHHWDIENTLHWS